MWYSHQELRQAPGGLQEYGSQKGKAPECDGRTGTER